MFGTKEKNQEKVKNRVMERNVIAKKSTFIGDVTSEGDFRIDGILEGTLKTKGRVIIGTEGVIKGNIEAENADIEGKFSGQLLVANTLTIKATANISGDVVIGKLSVEPGATFNATCAMKGALKDINSKNEREKSKKKPLNKAIALSGAGLQMGVTTYLGFLLGSFLDKKFETSFLTITITLIAIFLATYLFNTTSE